MTTTKEIKSKNDDPSLSDAQKFVGGYVEVVQVNDGLLIVDEEGKMKNKPVNEVASKMYADKYGDEDIIVGDVIYIPTIRGTISASGQLQKPGLIDFEDGRTVRYYLNRAGGYSYGADKGGARLIRARTGVRERLDNDLIVEAGDELWVPEKERVNIWAFTQSTMRTIAETLTLIILIRSL